MSLVDLGKRLLESAKCGQTEEVRTLMSNGAPFTTDWLGTSPLHFAAQQGHVGTAEVLLRAGISRDARTKVDRTPLHVASQEGFSDVVDLLIKNGADIEAKDMLKMTPLHWAVEKGHVGVIELLLGHGADINIDNKFDKSPVDIAINNGRADLAELLQLARLPQQNVVEVTTDATVEEEVTATTQIETQNGLESVIDATTEQEIGGTDQSSTAVLATLAALAEATGPLNSSATSNTTAAEALNWLESHGITMISGDNPSGLEGGQTLSLTEAGKLALDFVKQKVITVGGDDTALTDEEGNPLVIRLTGDPETDEPLLKKIKMEHEGEVILSDDGHYILTKSEPEEGGATFGETIETIEESVVGEQTVTEEGVALDADGVTLETEGVTLDAEQVTLDTDDINLESGAVILTEEGVVTSEGVMIQDDMIHTQSQIIQSEAVIGEVPSEFVSSQMTGEDGFEVSPEEGQLDVGDLRGEDQEGSPTETSADPSISDQLTEITSKT